MIILDTNFLISSVATGSPQALALRDWLVGGETVRTSIMVWAEFLCGPVSNENIQVAAALTKDPEPILVEDAVRGADLFNAAGRRRGSLADCLIAATCLRLGAQLATDNLDDFRRFEPMGLRLAKP